MKIDIEFRTKIKAEYDLQNESFEEVKKKFEEEFETEVKNMLAYELFDEDASIGVRIERMVIEE